MTRDIKADCINIALCTANRITYLHSRVVGHKGCLRRGKTLTFSS